MRPWRLFPALLALWSACAGSIPETAATPAVTGTGRWWFAVDELTVSDRPTPAALPVLRKLCQQLEERQIELILLPVPLRAEICASRRITSLFPPDREGTAWSRSTAAAALCGEAAPTVDLLPAMRRDPEPENWYCRSDSHWSPALVQLAARETAAIIRSQPWYRNETRVDFPAQLAEIIFTGDLAAAAGVENAPESQTVRRIEGNTADKNAPILLIGDSHALIFSTGGDMLSTNAGLAEQLAYELGLPVERLANRGSGGSAVWQQVYRRGRRDPEWLQNKKVVIWCFSVRELLCTDATWQDIPVPEKINQQLELK